MACFEFKTIVSKENGFTFVELMGVFFVVTIGLFGVFAFMRNPIIYTSRAASQLTAANLAQEGIEIVRNLRDGNWVEEISWNTGLSAGDYEADYQSVGLNLYSGNNLKINAEGFYNYSSGLEARFKRKITIDDSGLPDFLKIKVEVSWQDRGKPYKIEVQENLYNWWTP